MWASAGGRGPLSCCCGWALRSSASGLLGNKGFPGQGLNLCFLRWQADSDPWCARKPLGLAASQGQTRGVRHIHTAAQPLPEPSHLPSPRLCWGQDAQGLSVKHQMWGTETRLGNQTAPGSKPGSPPNAVTTDDSLDLPPHWRIGCYCGWSS